jgi:hypothetical protein
MSMEQASNRIIIEVVGVEIFRYCPDIMCRYCRGRIGRSCSAGGEPRTHCPACGIRIEKPLNENTK